MNGAVHVVRFDLETSLTSFDLEDFCKGVKKFKAWLAQSVFLMIYLGKRCNFFVRQLTRNSSKERLMQVNW